MAELLTDTPLTLRRMGGHLVAVIPDELAEALSLSEGDQIAMGKLPASTTNGEHDDDLEYAVDYMTRHARLFEALGAKTTGTEDDLMPFVEDYMDRHSAAFEELAK